MGYQALLFCPDEKTARTVTQVLGELEFSVETCAEPFAAVKKLMGEHFDAIVVDCDNEQNATLLFKSARNSTSNQSSLAVAVVEGQAGVAKAFRIGANLVLTKPINVEQAKGTLRVARGLLRKGEPGKPAVAPSAPVAAAAPAASPAKPVAPKSVAPPKPAIPVTAEPPAPPAPRSVQPPSFAVSSHAVEASRPNAMDEDLLELNVPEPRSKTVPVAAVAPKTAAPALPAEEKPAFRPAPAAPTFAGGAASAPAPAREVKESQASRSAAASHAADDLFEKPAASAERVSPLVEPPVPSFTFGGANSPQESTGGSKKIFLGVAAAVIAAAGIYFAWSHFQGKGEQRVSVPETTASAQPKPISSAPSPTAAKPAASIPPAVPQSAAQPSTTMGRPASNSADADEQPSEEVGTASKSGASKPESSAKSPDTATEASPLFVKRGAAPSIHKAPAVADAPAPSLIGMATTGASAPPPDLVGNINEPKPVLQTLNISQGVSQGLLIKKVQPVYPQNALAMHVEGAVEVLATISKTGSISAVKVLKGESLLARAATDAVRQWKYKPYQLNGEPVEIQTQITINFKLPH